MNRLISAKQVITLLLVFGLMCAPFARQANAFSIAPAPPLQQNEADEDGVTFDNLLAESSYIVYIEARDIGQQMRMGGLSELIEPLGPLTNQMPREIDLLAQFVVANAGALSHSRLMIATEPAKTSLPSTLIALELASADVAQEFQSKTQELIASMLSPLPAARADAGKSSTAPASTQPPQPSPFAIRRAGRLLAFSPEPFTFKGLRQEGDKPISDDPNFRAAHDRFYSETLFLYYDMALSARIAKERTERIMKQVREINEASKKANEIQEQSDESEKAEIQRNSIGPPPLPVSASPAQGTESSAPALQPEPDEQANPDKRLAGATLAQPSRSAASSVAAASASSKAASSKPAPSKPAPSKPAPGARSTGRRAGEQQKVGVAPLPPPPPAPAHAENQASNWDIFGNILRMAMTRSLTGSGMTGSASPDATALALTLEGDSLILRALVVKSDGMQFGPIPLFPVLISGPAQASGAAGYMPADTDVFITASLDLPQLYDTAFEMFKMYEQQSSTGASGSKEPGLESKVAAFEKANGFKIRDEIAATLGSEVAVGLPASYLASTPIAGGRLRTQEPQSGPIFMISVRDKEALQSRLRPALEAAGLKSPGEKGLVDKHGNAEINSYARISFAFIDTYLVIGSDAATIRRLLDARAKNETLATSRDFHGYMQWQPRETLAQGYVSAAVLKGLFKDPKRLDASFDDESKQFLARFNFEPEPITYLVASDVLGPLYELRIPKNLLKRAFAEIAVEQIRTLGPRNEMIVRGMLSSLDEMEKSYKTEHGRYATLEELEAFQFSRTYMERSGYKVDLTASDNRYEATAMPMQYGKTGRLSFYIDQSGVIREGDHSGGRATTADKKSN